MQPVTAVVAAAKNDGAFAVAQQKFVEIVGRVDGVHARVGVEERRVRTWVVSMQLVRFDVHVECQIERQHAVLAFQECLARYEQVIRVK